MKKYGFYRVAGASASLKVADPIYNVSNIIEKIDEAIKQSVDIICFSELSLSGFTCKDMFFYDSLIDECKNALDNLLVYLEYKKITVLIGMPIRFRDKLYDSCVVINNGKIKGITSRKELTDVSRWFSKKGRKEHYIDINDNTKDYYSKIRAAYDDVDYGVEKLVKFNNDFIFGLEKLCFGVTFGDPKYSEVEQMVNNGADLIFNLGSSNEVMGSYQSLKDKIKGYSKDLSIGYVYVGGNVNESSTDVVYSGSTLIYENGQLLNEAKRFNFDGELVISDIDVEMCATDRKFIEYEEFISYEDLEDLNKNQNLLREYSKNPFLSNEKDLAEVLKIQSYALAKRMKHIGVNKTVLGLSGGLDSTLAFLVILEANKILNISNDNIIAITMPGFGTTGRTLENAKKLALVNGVNLREIDITEACLKHFEDINHDKDIIDVTYENVQARERTQILMDIANKEGGIVVGTGDLSELALGWCTFNGDHMSMYSVNSSIPKTLVRHLIGYVKDNDEVSKDVLTDILDTPISPELLPPDEQGNIVQKTEDKIGPYILHDFFIYHFLKNRFRPKKIYFLATHTFKDDFTDEEILKWLKVFIRRFFSQQFKRNCMPDGAKAIDISLSSRNDFIMPSDVSFEAFIEELENI